MEIKVITFPKPDRPSDTFTMRIEFQNGTYLRTHFYHYKKGEEDKAFDYLISLLAKMYSESEK